MKIAIIGAAELGRMIASYAKNDCHYDIAGYYDDFNAAESFNGYPILGKTESVLRDYNLNLFDAIIIGIGYNHMNSRSGIFNQLKGKIPFANVIHSSAIIDSTSIIGEGIFILPGVVLDLEVRIEDNVLLNTGTIIAHNSVVRKHTFIAPGVNIAGLTEIGEKCFIGTGANIVDCLKIGNGSTIGAGSLVLNNTDENSVSIGSPSKIIRYNNK